MLLDWYAHQGDGRERYASAAAAVQTAIDATLADTDGRTQDLGGGLGTRAFTAALCQRL
jgi:isocitrate/isopropylmalate dehydrogenase